MHVSGKRKRNFLVGPGRRFSNWSFQRFRMRFEWLVGTGRFELPTPRTPSECSTRLSHVPTGRNPQLRSAADGVDSEILSLAEAFFRGRLRQGGTWPSGDGAAKAKPQALKQVSTRERAARVNSCPSRGHCCGPVAPSPTARTEANWPGGRIFLQQTNGTWRLEPRWCVARARITPGPGRPEASVDSRGSGGHLRGILREGKASSANPPACSRGA